MNYFEKMGKKILTSLWETVILNCMTRKLYNLLLKRACDKSFPGHMFASFFLTRLVFLKCFFLDLKGLKEIAHSNRKRAHPKQRLWSPFARLLEYA